MEVDRNIADQDIFDIEAALCPLRAGEGNRYAHDVPRAELETTSKDATLTPFLIADFHPTEPWILTTLYSGKRNRRINSSGFAVGEGLNMRIQVTSTSGLMNHR